MQNQPLNILVVQNSGESFKSNISFKFSTAARLHGYAEYRDRDNSFLIAIKSAEKGIHILQVFLNNTEVPNLAKCWFDIWQDIMNLFEHWQIPNSPFLIEIVSRNCSAGKRTSELILIDWKQGLLFWQAHISRQMTTVIVSARAHHCWIYYSVKPSTLSFSA